MASERHLGAVGDDQVVVGVKVISDGDVVSVIAPERRSEYHVFPHLSQQFGQDAALRFPIVGIQLVILVAFILAFADFRFKGGIVTPLKQTVDRNDRFIIHRERLLHGKMCLSKFNITNNIKPALEKTVCNRIGNTGLELL